MDKNNSITIMAPAKINLYLHVLGKRSDGYHDLDSLITFADIGDQLHISPAEHLAFDIRGPYAGAFRKSEFDITSASGNLVIRAAWKLANLTGHRLDLRIELEKNLPLSAGIGGGSADAAACIWGLLKYWKLPPDQVQGLDAMLVSLGADVPVCFLSQSAQIRGLGDKITPFSNFPEIPALLINPGKPCPTHSIFKVLRPKASDAVTLPHTLSTLNDMLDFIKPLRNDLQAEAENLVPDIQNIMNTLQHENGCVLARLSGSGATCFGLFSSEAQAITAGKRIAEENPDWWVRPTWFNRLSRY